MNYKAILLDFYGTLVVEDDDLIVSILENIAAHSPLSPDVKQIIHEWKFQEMCQASHGDGFRTQRSIELESLQQLCSFYKVNLDAKEMSECLFAYWQSPFIYEEARHFLGNNTLPVCVISNIDTADLHAACVHAGWEFDFVVTSEICKSYKPRPEMFLNALGKLGCQAHEVLHIGDSLSSDVKGAQALDIDVAWFNRKQMTLPSNMKPPTYAVSAFEELAFLFS